MPGIAMNRRVVTKSIDRNTQAVVEHLKRAPYLCADEIAKRESLTLGEVNAIYKIIQTSHEIQGDLNRSDNHDYFDTVRNHFGRKQYTVVFFVGLYCPSRCRFCPSVKIREDGFRELFRYGSRLPDRKKLGYEDLERIFVSLDQMQKEGVNVSIKISGGLEPFTDPKTIGWILQLANKYAISSTIFTNGMLLKLRKNRNLALKSNRIRVSLNSSDEKSYSESCFGSHKDNKKVALLVEVTEALRTLVAERDEIGSKTEVGINAVAGEYNFHELEKLVRDTSALGVDYVEIKGDYFESKNPQWFDRLEPTLAGISGRLVNGRAGNTRVALTGSLRRENFFNNRPQGSCLPKDQVAHKMFITPFGECTPVHYWAYPRGWQQQGASQFLGCLSQGADLLQLMKRADQLPKLDYARLNPFELILSLESQRQRRDRAFGIHEECNPYLPPTKLRPE